MDDNSNKTHLNQPKGINARVRGDGKTVYRVSTFLNGKPYRGKSTTDLDEAIAELEQVKRDMAELRTFMSTLQTSICLFGNRLDSMTGTEEGQEQQEF